MLEAKLISTATPCFTTPFLDFEDHSYELESMVNSLYEYRNELRGLSVDAQTVGENKQPRIVVSVFEGLLRFNTLTRYA